MKHTKGPWKVVLYKGPQYPLQGWGIKTDDELERPVAVVAEPIGGIKDEDGYSPSQRANARLISAAPDLLEAAKQLLINAIDIDEAFDDEGNMHSDYQALSDAIDKAEEV